MLTTYISYYTMYILKIQDRNGEILGKIMKNFRDNVYILENILNVNDGIDFNYKRM